MSVSTRELYRRLDDTRVRLTASLVHSTAQAVKLNQIVVTLTLFATVELFRGTDLVSMGDFNLLVNSDQTEDDIYNALCERIRKAIEDSDAIDVHKTRVRFLTPAVKSYV